MIAALVRRVPGLSRLELQDKEGGLRGLLIRGTSGTFALKVASAGFNFVISLLLARLLGVAGFGAYSFALAWVGLLNIPSILGFDRLLIREVAVHRTRSEWGLMKGLLLRTSQLVLLASCGVALLAAGAAWLLSGGLEPRMLHAFWVAMFLLPLTSLSLLRQAALRGLYRVVSGQVPEMFIRPVLFIALIGGVYLVLDTGMSASWAVGLNAVALAIAFLIGALMLRRSLPLAVKTERPAYATRLWLGSALPLMFVSGAQVINTRADIVMLGAIRGAEEAGVYTVATRGADLIAFVLLAVNAAFGPVVASLYAAGDLGRLQRVVTKSTRFIFLASLPLAVGFMVFGWWFMLIFGEGFTRGATALAILSAGQLVSAAVGTVGVLLVMTNYERFAALGVGIGAVINVGLNATLIPIFGLEGAAVATMSSLVVSNLITAVWVYRKLGIYPGILGRGLFGRET